MEGKYTLNMLIPYNFTAIFELKKHYQTTVVLAKFLSNDIQEFCAHHGSVLSICLIIF